MSHAAVFRQCLEECDPQKAVKIWAELFPNMPRPQTVNDALIVLHHTRTQAGSIAFKLRAYSHQWLLERGLPSGLPDELKPKAQREYPVVVGVVGIAPRAKAGSIVEPLIPFLQTEMSNAVSECYDDGKTDPVFVKSRIMAARDEFKRSMGLFLRGYVKAGAVGG